MASPTQQSIQNQSDNQFANVQSVELSSKFTSPQKKSTQMKHKNWRKQITCYLVDRQNSTFVQDMTPSQLSPDSISSQSTFFTTSTSLSEKYNKISQFGTKQKERQKQGGLLEVLYNKQKPLYIQNFSQLNSIEPQYLHPQFSMEQQVKKLSHILIVARYAISEVINIARDAEKRMRVKCGVEGLGLKFICNSMCKLCKLEWHFNRLKPAKQFKNSNQNIFDLIEKIQLLESKIQRYQIIISLTRKFDIDMYAKIRQSLIELEEDLIQFSSQLYVMVKQEKHYPSFCYAYVELIWQQQQKGIDQIAATKIEGQQPN